MIKDFVIVGMGSFFGGGLRYLISQLLKLSVFGAFPLGTFVVNVLGCFLIGVFSTLPENHSINPSTRLLLTTGLCGGFTTFSTFMNENVSLIKNDNFTMSLLYVFASLALGFIAVLAGRQLVFAFR